MDGRVGGWGETTESSSIASDIKSPSRGHLVPKWRLEHNSLLRAPLEQKGQQKDDFYTKRDQNPKFLHLKAEIKTEGIISQSVFWRVPRAYKQQKVSTDKQIWEPLG